MEFVSTGLVSGFVLQCLPSLTNSMFPRGSFQDYPGLFCWGSFIVLLLYLYERFVADIFEEH